MSINVSTPLYLLKIETLRRLTLLLFFSFLKIASAQNNDYQFHLELNDSLHILKGSLEVDLNANHYQKTDSIFIHLPPRSMEWKGSFVQKQFIDFQNIRLYYADENQKGSIKISKLKHGNKEFNTCTECEFVALPKNNVSKKLYLDFEIQLPNAAFTGIGFDGEVYRIIDWLPRLANYDGEKWHLNPVTFQSDWFHAKDNFRVELKANSQYKIASNLQNRGFKKLENNLTIFSFKQQARSNLQFYLSKSFEVHKINDSVSLFSTYQDPYLPSILPTLDEKTNNFFEGQFAKKFTRSYQLVILKNKVGEFQSDGVLSINYPKSTFDFSNDLTHARAEQIFRYEISPNGFKEVWLARGLPYYYKYEFIHEVYPEKKWLPLTNFQIIGKIFDLDEFDFGYQNQFLWLYIARQGLDQAMNTPADSLSRLNYEAITQAKTYLSLSHLEAYAGKRNFRRSMNRFYQENRNNPNTNSSDLKKAFNYFIFRDVTWFFDSLVKSDKEHDYQILKTDYCSTVSTATIVNKKTLAIPFSLTGYKDGEEIVTEWFDGHTGKKSIQTYHEKFDKVVINKHRTAPEYSQKNNTLRTKGLFKRAEPIRLQFFNSFENPGKSQIYWMPAFNYNNYDKLLLSVQLHNRSVAFVRKPFEYRLEPEYSTGTNTLTGSLSNLWNFTPSEGPFHRISTGYYARYNHYAEDLGFFRFSPSLNLFFRRKYAESKVLQKVRFRGIMLQQEELSDPENLNSKRIFDGFNLASATYTLENINLLKPYTIVTDFQIGSEFSLLSSTLDLRWMLANKHWLIWRNFGGVFLNNSLAGAGDGPTPYSMGLSGTQDYLFDYELIGRSDQSGIWSQQFFTSEGGFKGPTGVFANDYLFASNISIPLLTPFKYQGLRPSIGLFGDVGVADNFDKIYWDYGIRVSVFTDFLEVYLPIQNHETNFLTSSGYLQSVRFVFNLDPSEIIERIRRGYY